MVYNDLITFPQPSKTTEVTVNDYGLRRGVFWHSVILINSAPKTSTSVRLDLSVSSCSAPLFPTVGFVALTGSTLDLRICQDLWSLTSQRKHKQQL